MSCFCAFCFLSCWLIVPGYGSMQSLLLFLDVLVIGFQVPIDILCYSRFTQGVMRKMGLIRSCFALHVKRRPSIR
ncbi:hypothetical protein BJY00DRAFT_21029 [Aspergillus carlsbadensis]|nr:hypothetical protein BJY00DRAFT_21029 [Aspergillus carlsbadensis]